MKEYSVKAFDQDGNEIGSIDFIDDGVTTFAKANLSNEMFKEVLNSLITFLSQPPEKVSFTDNSAKLTVPSSPRKN